MSGPGNGLCAVVAKLAGGGGHGVLVIDARAYPPKSLLLTPDEWETMLPHIRQQMELARRPGELPPVSPDISVRRLSQ